MRREVISIVDLGNDNYLIAFSHKKDKSATLSDGPWFIYNQYLTVKYWSLNFLPEGETIEKVEVWICIVSLPREYYDAKILSP